MNSLSAIAGHEGDEEDWEREMRGFNNEDEVSVCAQYTFLIQDSALPWDAAILGIFFPRIFI
jgi:hypothetical protein